MGGITTFRDLTAWQVGMDLVELTYRLTSRFPDSERYGLSAQMRRAAVSIPSNVAEGQGVKTVKWSLKHVRIAIGSALELETQLELAIRLKYVSKADASPMAECLDRTQKLLYGMRREKELRIGAVVAVLAATVLAAAHGLI